MPAATLYDTGAPTLEVRIYDHDRLLAREHCQAEEDASAVVERWSQLANLFVVADDLSSKHQSCEIPDSEEPLIDGDAHCPIAATPVPGCGTE